MSARHLPPRHFGPAWGCLLAVLGATLVWIAVVVLILWAVA